MIKLLSLFTYFLIFHQAQASPHQNQKMYDQKIFKSDNDKIKYCLAGLYDRQIKFRQAKGYFATLPNELDLNKYRVCDGLEISTHYVSDSAFKMTAKFNQKVWSVDQLKTIRQIH